MERKSPYSDPELVRRARGIADEFERCGTEAATVATLRTLADRYEQMDSLIAKMDEGGKALGAIVLECVKAGHVTVAVAE